MGRSVVSTTGLIARPAVLLAEALLLLASLDKMLYDDELSPVGGANEQRINDVRIQSQEADNS